jgi:hypothetical protein
LWQTLLVCLNKACFEDQEWKGRLYAPVLPLPWAQKCGEYGQCSRNQAHWEPLQWRKEAFHLVNLLIIHTEQHSVINGLKYYGYAGIDDSSKVCHLLKGIKTTELDFCKTHVMASPSLRDDFAATV